jgi:hypothetical protein
VILELKNMFQACVVLAGLSFLIFLSPFAFLIELNYLLKKSVSKGFDFKINFIFHPHTIYPQIVCSAMSLMHE